MDTKEILNQLVVLDGERAGGRRGAREEMLRLAHDLVSSLEVTSEMMQRTCWAEPANLAGIRTALDLNLFEKLSEASKNGISVEELAQSTSADPVLLNRLLKHLCAMHVIAEKEQGVYQSTKRSDELIMPKYRDGIMYNFDVVGPSWKSWPKFFAQTKYKNPVNPIDGPFQFAHNTKTHFWPWLEQNPPYFQYFANFMAGYRDGKTSWMDPGCYPVREQLFADVTSPGQVVLVDVGGGKGHELMTLKASYPDIPGKLVLQDKPEVIQESKDTIDNHIESMSHDIFNEQIIKGAKAYFMHSVLHGYPDHDAVTILKQLKPALKAGYSKILINELVVPDTDATWPYTSMDLLMLTLGSVKERTEKNWRQIFEDAGLQIQMIWNFGHGSESLIEATLPPQ